MTVTDRLIFLESSFEKLEHYFIFNKLPILPIDTISLANFIGLELISFSGQKENLSDFSISKREYSLMCFLNRKTSSIHYNRYFKKIYLNFAVAHELCHFLGNFDSPIILEKTENSESRAVKDNPYEKIKQMYLTELIADTFSYNLLYPTGAFISLLLNKNIREIINFLSPHYPIINIVFKILNTLNTTSFFVLFDPRKNYFTQFTIKIPVNQYVNILSNENKVSAENVIISNGLYQDIENLTWFGNLLNAKGIHSSIYADTNTIRNILKQLTDNSIDRIGKYYLKNKKARKNNFAFYGNYSFDILSPDMLKILSINSSFFHLVFPIILDGRTSGKRFFILAFCIDDSMNLFEQFIQYKKEPSIPRELIKSIDEDFSSFNIYSWLNRLREILNLPQKNYIEIYGRWPTGAAI